MTLSLVILLAGIIIWGIFTKWTKVADGWVAEVGHDCFWVGLLAYLIANGVKAVL